MLSLVTAYDTEVDKLQAMVDDVGRMRDCISEPKAHTNPRYHTLSRTISADNRAVPDMQHKHAARGASS